MNSINTDSLLMILLLVFSEVRVNTELAMEVMDMNFRTEGGMAGTPGT